MNIFGTDLANDVAIVAEVGVNHEGDLNAALNLVRLAAESGADAVKFQSYTPSRYASASDPERLERVSRFALDKAAHRQIAKEADSHGIFFFSTPLTEDMVPFLDELCPAVKIASGDLDFEPVIRAAARTGKPVILSTGCGTVEEIDRAVSWLTDEIGANELKERVILMHCISSYPTPIDQANVRSVPFIADRYGLPTGYSHHAIGLEPCFAAIALGACLIEVHFTDCKEGRTFRDHELSLEPDELSALVKAAPRIKTSLGQQQKSRQECESGSMLALRKGLVAARDLPSGTVLAREDIMFARPATEFTSAEIEEVIGQTLNAAIHRGETLVRTKVST